MVESGDAEKLNIHPEAFDRISNCEAPLNKSIMKTDLPYLGFIEDIPESKPRLEPQGIKVFTCVWGCEKCSRQKGHCVERQRDGKKPHCFQIRNYTFIWLKFGLLGQYEEKAD